MEIMGFTIGQGMGYSRDMGIFRRMAAVTMIAAAAAMFDAARADIVNAPDSPAAMAMVHESALATEVAALIYYRQL